MAFSEDVQQNCIWTAVCRANCTMNVEYAPDKSGEHRVAGREKAAALRVYEVNGKYSNDSNKYWILDLRKWFYRVCMTFWHSSVNNVTSTIRACYSDTVAPLTRHGMREKRKHNGTIIDNRVCSSFALPLRSHVNNQQKSREHDTFCVEHFGNCETTNRLSVDYLALFHSKLDRMLFDRIVLCFSLLFRIPVRPANVCWPAMRCSRSMWRSCSAVRLCLAAFGNVCALLC